MALPELPVEVDDPTYDTQRDGTRDQRVTQTHRGKGREKLTNQPQQPEGPIRYKDQ